MNAPRELAGIAVGNLLRNACLYTKHGKILVDITAEALAVEDTGPGLPDAQRDRLTADAPCDSPSIGNGRGLSIVKRVIEHLGWELRLDTSAAAGTRVVLVFAPVPPFTDS